jgi:hypothetical protein
VLNTVNPQQLPPTLHYAPPELDDPDLRPGFFGSLAMSLLALGLVGSLVAVAVSSIVALAS